MPSINMRQLRNTRQLKEWLGAGQTVELRERDEVVARILPVRKAVPASEWPDFGECVRKVMGDRVVSGADLLISDRGRY